MIINLVQDYNNMVITNSKNIKLLNIKLLKGDIFHYKDNWIFNGVVIDYDEYVSSNESIIKFIE
jgi:hypothetical protein